MALYRKRKPGASSSSGQFPEYGAIFMSNSRTKEECLRRNLFGLPLSSAHFVKAVRSGMILFLFEYEHRVLYGVFEAISDGQLNIFRHAYRSSSSKSFPAQVRVRVIWNCLPLTEEDFRDAISDNYYGKYKFNFGLSKQQVQRLLRLFDSKRMGLERPLLKDKAKKRHISNDRANLVTSSGDLSSVSKSKQVSVDEQVKSVDVCTTSSVVLEDNIPLSSPDCSDTEVNVNVTSRLKALYSATSEERSSLFPRSNLHLQSAAQENDRNSTAERSSRQFSDSDLLPRFIRQKEKGTLETDRPVKKILEILEQRHDNWKISSKRGHSKASVRGSVFSRLSYT